MDTAVRGLTWLLCVLTGDMRALMDRGYPMFGGARWRPGDPDPWPNEPPAAAPPIEPEPCFTAAELAALCALRDRAGDCPHLLEMFSSSERRRLEWVRWMRARKGDYTS